MATTRGAAGLRAVAVSLLGLGLAATSFGFTVPQGETSNVETYVETSGTVIDAAGNPVRSATVKLTRSDSPSGPFTVVNDGNSTMSETNRRNPSTTGEDGKFSWDVKAGYYVIEAAAHGCLSPETGAAKAVTGVLQVPTEHLGLKLVLDCWDHAGPTPTPTPTATPTPTPTPAPTTPSPTQPSKPTETSTPSPTQTETPEPVTPTLSPSPSTAGPTVSVVADNATPGSAISVHGEGFAPNETIEVWMHSTPRLLATVTASATGKFDDDVLLPIDSEVGAHELLLVGASSGTASANFKVVAKASNGAISTSAATPSSSSSKLVTTGSNGLTLAVVGAGLLALGSVLLFRRRAVQR